MKKRMLSLALSLSLAVSLFVPAFAAEDTAPMEPPGAVETAGPSEDGPTGAEALYETEIWAFAQQYKENHPEEWTAFDADAWYEQEWSDFFASKEEYMEYYDLPSEEEFREDLWVEYVVDAAYEEYEDFWQNAYIEEYRANHPGELEELGIDGILALYGYTKTMTPLEQYMEDWGWTSEEGAQRELLLYYVNTRTEAEERHARVEEYRAEDPESWENFDAESYFAERYYYYDDKADFMKTWDLFSEEEFVEFMYLQYMEWQNPTSWYRNATPSLVVNGFPVEGVVPELENGVSYTDAETLNAILGTSLTGDRVAIRDAAQAAGWDVAWNEWNAQVILLDRERLTQGIIYPEQLMTEGTESYRQRDLSQFEALLTRLFAAVTLESDQTFHTVNTYDLTFTAFNSLDGDETYTAQIEQEIMTRPDVMELTVTFRLADLLRLVPQETLAEIAAYMPKSALPNIGDLLTGCRLRVILNSREGKLYWNFPLLALFDSTHTITEDTWISMDLGSDAGEGITEENWAALLADGELHIGELLYRQLLDNSANNEAGAVLAYLRFMQTFSTIQNLFGPETIEEKDGTLTWHLPADIVNAYLMQNLYVSSYAGEDSEADLWKELDVALSVSQAGEIDLHAAFRLDMDAIAQTYADRYSYYDASEAMLMRFVMGWLDARYTAQASFQGNKGSAAMELHWKNQMKLTVETETVRELTDELPAEQPPEGSNVIEG